MISRPLDQHELAEREGLTDMKQSGVSAVPIMSAEMGRGWVKRKYYEHKLLTVGDGDGDLCVLYRFAKAAALSYGKLSVGTCSDSCHGQETPWSKCVCGTYLSEWWELLWVTRFGKINEMSVLGTATVHFFFTGWYFEGVFVPCSKGFRRFGGLYCFHT